MGCRQWHPIWTLLALHLKVGSAGERFGEGKTLFARTFNRRSSRIPVVYVFVKADTHNFVSFFSTGESSNRSTPRKHRSVTNSTDSLDAPGEEKNVRLFAYVFASLDIKLIFTKRKISEFFFGQCIFS